MAAVWLGFLRLFPVTGDSLVWNWTSFWKWVHIKMCVYIIYMYILLSVLRSFLLRCCLTVKTTMLQSNNLVARKFYWKIFKSCTVKTFLISSNSVFQGLGKKWSVEYLETAAKVALFFWIFVTVLIYVIWRESYISSRKILGDYLVFIFINVETEFQVTISNLSRVIQLVRGSQEPVLHSIETKLWQ